MSLVSDLFLKFLYVLTSVKKLWKKSFYSVYMKLNSGKSNLILSLYL